LAINSQVKTLRAHKVAALVLDARLYARRTPEEACGLLGWDIKHLQALETAAVTPTLPELESLAAIYAVPVDHFFGSTSLSDEMPKLRVETMRQRLELRNRILGAMIMQARSRRNLSRDDLSMATNLSIEQITQYEMGQVPLPVTDLEDITRMLQINVFDWIDSYAIPTRDMVFKPYKVEVQKSKQPINEPEENPSQLQQTVEQVTPEPGPAQTQPVQSQNQQTEVPNPVQTTSEQTEKTESIQPQHTQESEAELIELAADVNLPSELVEFISNPVNKQYLVLASNLSHMPADQLRRIAESLLEITF
jgi:transcriptional regulator with XRE-family HTH domain